MKRDKAGRSAQRLKIMKNDQTLYGILADSEEIGRGAIEMAVYATCILSVVAAIVQFMGQPTPDPFAGFDPAAQPAPVVSHTVQAATPEPVKPDEATRARVSQTYGKLPLSFEANNGQQDQQVKLPIIRD